MRPLRQIGTNGSCHLLPMATKWPTKALAALGTSKHELLTNLVLPFADHLLSNPQGFINSCLYFITLLTPLQCYKVPLWKICILFMILSSSRGPVKISKFPTKIFFVSKCQCLRFFSLYLIPGYPSNRSVEWGGDNKGASPTYRNDPKFSDTQKKCCNHSKV